MGWRIMIPSTMRPEGRNFLLQHGHELVERDKTDVLSVMKDIKEMDAAIIQTTMMSREILSTAKKLKAIACLGYGYDLVDVKAANDYGIRVVNCPEANVTSTVEMTIFYMLYCSKQFTRVRRDYIDDYEKARNTEKKQELWDKQLGIIGFGSIGSRVAKICAESFHMKVMVYDPYRPLEDFPEYVRVTRNLDELLMQSDIISLHLAMDQKAPFCFGMDEFEKMKKEAYLINTSGAALVDEDALLTACKDDMIAGAALDFLRTMPFAPDNPLLYMDNILVAPHMGCATREADTRTSLQAAMGLQEIYEGKEPTYEMKLRDWNQTKTYVDTRL